LDCGTTEFALSETELHRQNDHKTIIFQRLQAEEALKELERKEARLRLAGYVRTIWSERTFLVRLSLLGFVLGLFVAFLIPVLYTSSARLMPPDNHSGSSPATVAASMVAACGAGSFGDIAGDVLGLKSTQ
jgi:hypothetical protein